MKYTIIDYRPVQSSDKSYYFIEVKIRYRSYLPLLFIPMRKTKWIMAGKDGHPRFFEREGGRYQPDNRLLVATTKKEAEEKIKSFKTYHLTKR